MSTPLYNPMFFFSMDWMIWSAQSLDLNSIQNLWCIIKIRISMQHHRICDIEELDHIIKKEWDWLDTDLIWGLIETMEDHCQAYKKARRSTEYWPRYEWHDLTSHIMKLKLNGLILGQLWALVWRGCVVPQLGITSAFHDFWHATVHT